MDPLQILLLILSDFKELNHQKTIGLLSAYIHLILEAKFGNYSLLHPYILVVAVSNPSLRL